MAKPPSRFELSEFGHDGTLPKTTKGQITRQRLLDAAEEVLGEKNYWEASVVDVIHRAGVSQGTFYLYFPSKLAIFRELVLGLSRNLRREIAENVAQAHNREEFERLGFEAFFRFNLKHRNLYKIVRQAEWVEPDLFQAYYQKLQQGYVNGLREARQRGEIRDDIDLDTLAYLLMGMGDYLGMRWVLWENRLPPAEAVDTLIRVAMQGMGAKVSGAEVNG